MERDPHRDRAGPGASPQLEEAMEEIELRTDLRPGDIGTIVSLHGTVYAREQGFDPTFEAYVAGPLSGLALDASERECLWIAERDGAIVGCVAIVDASAGAAQLRWYLVVPEARGRGLGRRLLREAIGFCRATGYASISLWTVSALEAAAHLYREAGFVLAEERPGRRWGQDVVEERYELILTPTGTGPEPGEART